MTAPQFGQLTSAGEPPAPAPVQNGQRQARGGPMPTGGRWGWYRDHEGNEHRRVSKLVKKVETDTYNLDLWYKRQVAEGLAIRDDLVLSIKAMGRPDPVEGWSKLDKQKIDGIVKEAEAAAKQRNGARVGTAVHDLTERIDRGEPVEEVTRGLPAGPSMSLRAYDFLRRENGYRSVEIERTVVCDEVEAAGTFDRVDEVEGMTALLGPWVCQHGHDHGTEESRLVVDVKTEAKPWLNGLHIGPQLAIYSRSKRMWRPTGGTTMVQYGKTTDPVEVPAGEYVPAPCVRQDVGIVVHVFDGRATPIFINLVEGWSAALAAYEQMNREARAKKDMGSPGAWFVPVPNVKEPRPVQMLSEHAVTADFARPDSRVPLNPEWAEQAVAGSAVTVAGVDFVKHTEPGAGCLTCSPLLSGASATRVDGTDALETCTACGRSYAQAMPVMVGDKVAGDVGDTLTISGVRTHKAVRGPDGLVRWAAVDDLPPEPHLELGKLGTMLIGEIWKATTLDRLAELWQLATDNGVPWRGAVKLAGDARRRQIECPQRALHTGGGKCACGWMPPVPA